MQHPLVRRALAPVVLLGLGLGVFASPVAADPAHGRHGGDHRSTGADHAAASTPANATTATTAGSDDHPDGGDAPPGNNGTIKVERSAAPSGPANAAHVGCDFWVSFFGYDAGTQTGRLVFTAHAPTSGSTLLDVTTTWTTAERTAGNQLDTTYGPVNLIQAFQTAGIAPKAQGYHVELTVTVTGSRGAATKHKVFWTKPCAPSAPAAAAASASRATTGAAELPTAVVGPSSASAATAAAPADVEAAVVSPAAGAVAVVPDIAARAFAAGVAVPSAATVAAATVSRSPASAAPATGGRLAAASLPRTGAEVGGLLMLALVLIGTGVVLRRAGRRRPDSLGG